MRESKSKKYVSVLKKMFESKGLYIGLFSLIIIIGVYVYAGNMKKAMQQDFVAFDENAWQQALGESDIEVIDVDPIPENEGVSVSSSSEKAERTFEETSTAEAVETVAESLPAETETSTGFSMVMPCEGNISAECSVDELVYCSTTEDWRTHNGIDISAAEGTEVRAVEKGVVSKVFEDKEFGVVVVLEHSNGLTTRYGNLQSVDSISAGTKVEKGDIIGGVGQPGALESDSGTHLHFEVLAKGEYKNPIDYIGR